MGLTYGTFLVALTVKNLPAMLETQVPSLGQEDPLEKEMAGRSSILAWRIPGTEETGGLQTTELQRLREDWVTEQQQRYDTISLQKNFVSTVYKSHRQKVTSVSSGSGKDNLFIQQAGKGNLLYPWKQYNLERWVNLNSEITSKYWCYEFEHFSSRNIWGEMANEQILMANEQILSFISFGLHHTAWRKDWGLSSTTGQRVQQP